MPISLSLLTQLFLFSFTLWLGAYLLARHSSKPAVRLTGWGLMAYALALSGDILFGQRIMALAPLPALMWIGAALHLLPAETAWRAVCLRLWALGSGPLLILVLLNGWLVVIVIAALAACAGAIARLAWRSQFRSTLAVLAVVTLFLTLSTGLMTLPANILSNVWGVSLLGLDLLALGLAIIVWDAFDEGESIRLHLWRSCVAAMYSAGTLSVLVIIAAAIDGALTFGKLLLLISLMAFGILTQTFSTSLQRLLDRVALPASTDMRQQRAVLQQTAADLPRQSGADPFTLDEAEFARLTRRAISHLSDLPRLSTSPLVNLPGVQDGQNPLERAIRLKALLIAHIQRLKPPGPAEFGSSAEWRYYNALHFPYVIGVKPYTHRVINDASGEAARQASAWFRASVPERTLHNWQNAATKLVAQSLREAQ